MEAFLAIHKRLSSALDLHSTPRYDTEKSVEDNYDAIASFASLEFRHSDCPLDASFESCMTSSLSGSQDSLAQSSIELADDRLSLHSVDTDADDVITGEENGFKLSEYISAEQLLSAHKMAFFQEAEDTSAADVISVTQLVEDFKELDWDLDATRIQLLQSVEACSRATPAGEADSRVNSINEHYTRQTLELVLAARRMLKELQRRKERYNYELSNEFSARLRVTSL